MFELGELVYIQIPGRFFGQSGRVVQRGSHTKVFWVMLNSGQRYPFDENELTREAI